MFTENGAFVKMIKSNVVELLSDLLRERLCTAFRLNTYLNSTFALIENKKAVVDFVLANNCSASRVFVFNYKAIQVI